MPLGAVERNAATSSWGEDHAMATSQSFSRYLVLGIVVVVVVLIGAISVTVWRANARLAAKLAELRAAGEPVTLAELKPLPIPDNVNAAAQVARIAQDLAAFEKQYFEQFENTDLGKSWNVDRGDLPTPAQAAAMDAVLTAHPSILPALHRAAACPQYVSQLDFQAQRTLQSQDLSKLLSIRALARYVSAEMSVLAAQGKNDEAVRLGIDLLRITRQFDHEPFMTAYLVSLATRGMASYSINDVLQRGTVSPEVSNELDAELALHDPLARLHDTFRTERVYGLNSLDQQIGGVIGALHWPKLNWQAALLDFYAAAMDAAKLQWFEGQGALATARMKASGVGGFLSQLLTSIDAAYLAANRVTAQLRCLRILNALRSYELANGEESPGLDGLKLPRAAIIDPFTGQPLILKQTDKGWIIYSVFSNGRDDGGTFKEMKDWGLAPPGHEYLEPSNENDGGPDTVPEPPS